MVNPLNYANKLHFYDTVIGLDKYICWK